MALTGLGGGPNYGDRFGEWCNGSTIGSGPISLGSNPSSPALGNPRRSLLRGGFLLYFHPSGSRLPHLGRSFRIGGKSLRCRYYVLSWPPARHYNGPRTPRLPT